jgi:hypothetical protein
VTDAPALVAALRQGRTWQQVAATLAAHGAEHPRSYWHAVASGRFDPGWRELDALLTANGQPAQGPPPAKVLEASGVERIITVSDDPDLALLVRVEGAMPTSVSIRANGGVPEQTVRPSLRVTYVTLPKVTRKRTTTGFRFLSLSDIGPVEPAKIGRGKSGEPGAIRAAAQAAARVLEEGR